MKNYNNHWNSLRDKYGITPNEDEIEESTIQPSVTTERTLEYTEEELLNRIKKEYRDFLPFFQRHAERVKKLFQNGDESYLVAYTKFDGVNENIKTDQIDSLRSAFFHLFYYFESDISFDSVWINNRGEEVYSFGMMDPISYEEEDE